MAIVVTLSPELEALLHNKAIQQGLDDFEAGRFQSFQNFAEE